MIKLSKENIKIKKSKFVTVTMNIILLNDIKKFKKYSNESVSSVLRRLVEHEITNEKARKNYDSLKQRYDKLKARLVRVVLKDKPIVIEKPKKFEKY